MISGGFAGEGESSLARKAHLRSIRSGEVMEVQAVSKLPLLDTAITFSDSDLEGCQHPHDDPLVIRAVVANKTVHRVLVDNESLADIIFASVTPPTRHPMGMSGEGFTLRDCDSLTFSFSELSLVFSFICIIFVIIKICLHIHYTYNYTHILESLYLYYYISLSQNYTYKIRDCGTVR